MPKGGKKNEMKINLNISEDEELRSAVKDMIRGQVKSASREEFRQMIIESVGKNSITKEVIERLLRDSIASKVKAATSENSWGEPDLKKITKEIRIAVAKEIESMRPEIKEILSAYIEKYVKEILESDMDEIISERIRKIVSKMLK